MYHLKVLCVYICVIWFLIHGDATRETDRRVVIKKADMSEDMQQDAVDCATQALEKYNIEKDIATYIKKEFDKKYNPTWQCIAGRNVDGNVSYEYETKHFIYFYLGQFGIILIKAGGTDETIERLDIINEAKLPLWITEMTIEASNATLKASAFVDLMTLYFSYPRVKGILIGGSWGGVVRDIGKVLWEGVNATTPMVPNAAGVAVENLLKNTWMTKETLNVINNEQQTVNVFQGNYQLKVKQNRNVAIDFSATPIAITVQ